DLLPDAADVGGEHRTTEGPRLEHRNVRRSEERRHDQAFRFGVERGHVRILYIAELMDGVADAELLRASAHVRGSRPRELVAGGAGKGNVHLEAGSRLEGADR